MALLILPLRWLVAAMAAAMFHEFCHYIMLKLCGVSVYGLSIGANGAKIAAEPMPSYQELLCAMAGPLGSFVLLLTARWFPILAMCAGIHGLYNMLPVMPFDGGRALKSFLEMCCPKIKDDVLNWARILVCGLVLTAGILGLRIGCAPFLFSLILLRKMLSEKKTLQRRPEKSTIVMTMYKEGKI